MSENKRLGDFKRVVDAALEHGRVFIAGHINPDGDAVGSCFALAVYFAHLGIVPCILLEEFSDRFDALPGAEYVHRGQEIVDGEVLICLDCATKERLGPALSLFDRAALTVAIDHHVSNTLYSMINIIDDKASSACELMYLLLEGIGAGITIDMAEALYTGIIADTGCFRHSSTTARTHIVTAKLIQTGVDFGGIIRKVIYEHSEVEAAAFAAVINGMRIVPDLRLALSGLDYEQLESIGAKGSDLEGIVEYMLNTVGVEAAAMLSEREPGLVNVSLRSVKLNVNEIAKTFGGGGHVNAAGCRLRGTMREAADMIEQAVRKVYGT